MSIKTKIQKYSKKNTTWVMLNRKGQLKIQMRLYLILETVTLLLDIRNE